MVRMAGPWQYVVCAVLLLTTASCTEIIEEEPVYTPHLEARLPVFEERTYPGSMVATITLLYEVVTDDWDEMQVKIMEQLAYALENSRATVTVDHLDVTKSERLVWEGTCALDQLQCGDVPPGDHQKEQDPRTCNPQPPPPATGDEAQLPGVHGDLWIPNWASDAELEQLVWTTPFCVSETNTSLMIYPLPINNTYVTGYRDHQNLQLYENETEIIDLYLHVVGVIPVSWARFFNAKFQLDGEVPLPLFQPGVVDETREFTDDLNETLKIFGMRQGDSVGTDLDLIEHVPVCRQPATAARACFRVELGFYEHPELSEYKLKSIVMWNRHFFVQRASEQPYLLGTFTVKDGPWPALTWLAPREEFHGPWRVEHFPQKEWTFQEECQVDTACDPLPYAPSSRYMHSAVLYRTWNFEENAHRLLCNEVADCAEDCLTNLTCLGGVSYFNSNFYFRSEEFNQDDGGDVPVLPLENRDCPEMCCGFRRLCMRKHDVMGYEVPFDATMMLVFGGKTYLHEKDPETGKLIYHGCEHLPTPLQESWRSCNEQITNELWRYDIARAKWEFIKPAAERSPTTGEFLGFPASRFGHTAAVIEVAEGSNGMKRVYMCIYGGWSLQCTGNICNDVWKYEIAWAAQALYPKFLDVDEWDRGNQWFRMNDCPFGGRFRHVMTTTNTQEYLYVFGGKGIGKFHSELIRYRVSTDMWENLDPLGRKSLTRLMYDYNGLAQIVEVETRKYNRLVDVDCRTSVLHEGLYQHCRVCPTCGLLSGTREEEASLPMERGDATMVNFVDASEGSVDDALGLFAGYRTTWGDLVEEGAVIENPGQYYFNDLWLYETTLNRFQRHYTSGEAPSVRRGHTMIARRARTNDTQLLMFGGHYQDQQNNEMWTLDVMRDEETRTWSRMDEFVLGRQPPSMSWHSMVYTPEMDLIVIFGGLNWNASNLAGASGSDARRDEDRRCFKFAQSLPITYTPSTNSDAAWRNAEVQLVQDIYEQCLLTDFCCTMAEYYHPSISDTFALPNVLNGIQIRNITNGKLDMLAVSTVCIRDCEEKQFVPEFHPFILEGVWIFDPGVCPSNCSGHGLCDMSQCVCEPAWYGIDCSMLRCPGSICYVEPGSKEQSCIECSQHGRCVNGQCVCDPGWGYLDCSAVQCLDNCSSTPDEAHGICIEDFPVHECHCLGRWAGIKCDQELCLNGCSRRGSCINGTCFCEQNFYGDDCSLFLWDIEPGEDLARAIAEEGW